MTRENLWNRTWARRSIMFVVSLIMTFVLCEVFFRVGDYFTAAYSAETVDAWVKRISPELEEHSLLGYRRKPNQVLDELTQVDQFGLANSREGLGWQTVDVVGVGDSMMETAQRVFFERFKGQGVRYHSLALFGYGPANYDVLIREFGPKLRPKVFLYAATLGNDPGDVRRYESWRASGKGWYDYNGGYAFQIQRQGLVWGWRLFISRLKESARNVISKLKPDSYAALRNLAGRGDATTVFPYVLQAKELAHKQEAELQVVIVPRTPRDKPLLDPIAKELVSLCTAKQIDCLDLDPAFGPVESREKFFAPDGHWNELGMDAAWTYVWDRNLQSLLPKPDVGSERIPNSR